MYVPCDDSFYDSSMTSARVAERRERLNVARQLAATAAAAAQEHVTHVQQHRARIATNLRALLTRVRAQRQSLTQLAHDVTSFVGQQQQQTTTWLHQQVQEYRINQELRVSQ